MHLRVAAADGTELESTFESEPIRWVVGDGTLAAGLERALYGLAVGARQQLALAAGEAFGDRDPNLVKEMERSPFPGDGEPEPGNVWSFGPGLGEELMGTVVAVRGEKIAVDFNHPLAGEPVVLDVQVLAVEPPEGDAA